MVNIFLLTKLACRSFSAAGVENNTWFTVQRPPLLDPLFEFGVVNPHNDASCRNSVCRGLSSSGSRPHQTNLPLSSDASLVATQATDPSARGKIEEGKKTVAVSRCLVPPPRDSARMVLSSASRVILPVSTPRALPPPAVIGMVLKPVSRVIHPEPPATFPR